MHVSLIIDILTALALLHGLRYSGTNFRKLLCLASLIYLAYVSIHYFLFLGRYFGYLQRHPSLDTLARAELLKFFGGFWMLLGVMILSKAVTWIALIFTLYNVTRWLTKPKPPQVGWASEAQSITLQPRNHQRTTHTRSGT